MTTDLKQIEVTGDMLKKAPPMLITAIKGINKTFGLTEKMRKGLDANKIKTIVLVYDPENPSNDLENPPFTIYASQDDVILRIKQLEHLINRK